jgi:vacuolar-type H+-ATPase subunit F/Vma7
MKHHVLTSLTEPTDLELAALMQEVADETKRKFALVSAQLNEKIKEEIAQAQAKFKAQQK